MDSHRNPDGTFSNGHPGFKPRGAVSEIQKVTRQKLGEFLVSKLDELPTIWEKLSDRDKSRLILTISEFYLPKQKEIFIEPSEKETANYTNWSTEDLRVLSDLFFKYDPHPTIAEISGRESAEVMRRHYENNQANET